MVGSPPLRLTIWGTNFVPNQTYATFRGASLPVTVVSATQLTVTVDAPQLATAGTFPIRVLTLVEGGGAVSQAFEVAVVTAASAPAAAAELMVYPTPARESVTVRWNGVSPTGSAPALTLLNALGQVVATGHLALSGSPREGC
ncbi:IPT/TIG domain-containing protein [Hymenobacter sp. HDW8]|uniref:IPT/TIG domain-containing protein n=1 Tax=Hymenobacter sp. HDW8 TaxID=2714932 RepID=UPI00140DE501|nr:IPT/TIG domain-containing protein [Hymenobacter sp. HDW8]QIL78315.1 hypothetical protein G7064_21080 [Hymenobacter sp. HDW8]